MNWGSFKAELLARLQDEGLTSFLHGWYNDVQSEVDSRTTWRHFEDFAIRPTSAPYSTGTVDVTNGSATVTGVGTQFTSSMVGQLFTGPDGNVYEIAAFGSVTDLTISPEYIGTTEAGGTFTVTFYKMPLPDDFATPRLSAVTIQSGAGSDQRVYPIVEDQLLDYAPSLTWQAGKPCRYRFYGGSLILWPPCDQVYNLNLFYVRGPTELAESTPDAYDLSLDWPSNVQHVIKTGVLAQGLQHIGDDTWVAKRGEFEARLEKAVGRSNNMPQPGLGMRRWDDSARQNALGPGRFPRRLG